MIPDPPTVLRDLVLTGEIVDLAHPIDARIPVHPFHHGYTLMPHRRHGDTVRAGGSSFANELIVGPGHLGTHIDALGHFSRHGHLHGGVAAGDVQTHEGIGAHDATTIPLLVRRGHLLDAAATRGVECLEPGVGVDADLLAVAEARAGVQVEHGDVVLIRTGWARRWGDRDAYQSTTGCPGVDASGAEWLVERDVAAAGTDTAAFEVYPQGDDSVHALLLVDAGIPIIENLDLETLASLARPTFVFVALPLPLVGATASPLRPVALL